MADRVSKEVRSKIMSRIPGKNTGIEMLVFRDLRSRKIYFRKHYRIGRVTPDLAQPQKRNAVFIDGDFWHGYRYPTWRNKMKSKFWRDKIERNRARDRRNFALLRRLGWSVLRVWEHELHRYPDQALNKIATFLQE